MIYLISQILLCVALAGLLGGAIGWLLQRSRGLARLDTARRVIAEQARQLERARTDVTMLTDDFDDLRERSRVEIDTLRQENRQLPALAQNLEKSQLLVRQMIQRHDSQTRELETSNAALREQIAHLQEQVVTRERALAEAAKAAKGLSVGRSGERTDDAIAPAPDDAPVGDGVAAAGTPASGDERPPSDRDAGSGADDPAADGGTAGAVDVTGSSPDAAPDVASDAGDAEPSGGAARGAPPPRRGWASLPLAGGDAPEELLDEVMELDDDFAAELREDVDAGDGEGVSAADGGTAADVDEAVDETGTNELSETSRNGLDDGSAAPPWDEDEEGNATLAIEVFAMEDVHGVEDLDAPVSAEDPSAATGRLAGPLFRPVDRQDDLKRISGIGAVTEKALNELGITSYPQLARLERPEIEKLAEALEIGPERIERDDWVGNARRQLEDVLEEL